MIKHKLIRFIALFKDIVITFTKYEKKNFEFTEQSKSKISKFTIEKLRRSLLSSGHYT